VIFTLKSEQPGMKGFQECIQIYRKAFFESDSVSVPRIEELVRRDQGKLFSFSRGEEVFGFALVYIFRTASFAWLDYFAIHESVRGQGLGTDLLKRILLWLKESSPTVQVLLFEVGDDENEIGTFGKGWLRRVRFYSRVGARILEGVPYLFPGYGEKGPIPMALLAFPLQSQTTLQKGFVERAITEIYNTVHLRKSDDSVLNSFLNRIPAEIKLSALTP